MNEDKATAIVAKWLIDLWIGRPGWLTRMPERIELQPLIDHIAKETGPQITDARIEHMTNRFLAWKLPENFNPDCGITFDPVFNKQSVHGPQRHAPTGTNLFDAAQARAMVRHMIEGMD